MINIPNKIAAVAATLLITISPFAYSQGVGLDTTRVIYPANEKSVGVTIRNQEPNIDYLVQSYITSDKYPVTFEVTPPIFRLNSESKHEVKIYAMANTLPKDRETVFYFHANMIPGQEGKTEGLGMSVGFDNVIKLFYRPTNLTTTAEEAQKNLSFKVEGKQLIVNNNSPYYINFASISVNGNKLDVSLANNNAMIAPFDVIKYGLSTASAKGNIHWRTINDLGGFNEYTKKF